MSLAEKQPKLTPYEPWTPSPWAGVTGGLAAVVGTPLTMHFVARSAETAAKLAQTNAHEVYAQAGVGEVLNHALNVWNLSERTAAFTQSMADFTNVLKAPVAVLAPPLFVAAGEYLDPSHGEYTAQPTAVWKRIARTIHIPLAMASTASAYGVIVNLPEITHNIAQAIKLHEVPVPELASLGVLIYGLFSLWHAGKRIATFITYPTDVMRSKQKKILADFREAVSGDLPEEVRLRVDNAAKVTAMANRANFSRRLENDVLKNARRGARIVTQRDRLREVSLKKPKRASLSSLLGSRTPVKVDPKDIPDFLKKKT